MSNFDDATKTQVVLAATIAAGPDATEADVTSQAQKIIARLSPGSAILNAFDQADKREEKTEKVKTFRGTVLYVDKENDSQRAVVFLKTQESKWHPDGKEYARTERVDSTEGLQMAKVATGLIGHKVTITAGVELMANGNKVRVVRGLVDNGVDPAFKATDPAFQPSYEKLDLAKMASHAPKAA